MKKIGLILGVLNTVVIAAVLGLFIYTKVIYKRPAITENKERAKLQKDENKAEIASKGAPILVELDPIMVNLDAYIGKDGKEKVHFASMKLAVELRSDKEILKFQEAKPVIMDSIIQNLGKKKFDDLNQVQGRYVFRSQIVDAANEYLKAPVVTEVYFSDLLLQ